MNSQKIRALFLLLGVLTVSGCNLTADRATATPTSTPTALPTSAPTLTPAAQTPLPTASTGILPGNLPGILPTLDSGAAQSTTASSALPTITEEAVADLRGTVVGLAAGGQYDDYLQAQDGTRYGIASIDGVIAQQLASLRNTGTSVRLWGILRRNVPDYNNMQIQVTQLLLDQPTTASNTLTCTLAPRLSVNTSAMVALGPLPNAVRSAPGTASDSTILGSIPGGTIFNVLEGPVCASGYYWYRVDAGGFTGWTAEGQNGEYWLDPLACANGLSTRLVPGMYGRVTTSPALANNVRSRPDQGSASALLGEIPPGGFFTVLSGPQCGPEGMSWWRVNYDGLIGWTAEGDDGVYWLEPATGQSVTEPVSDWRGTIVGLAAGAQYDDYFERSNGTRYGLDSNDLAVRQQIAILRSTGRTVRLWGTLYRETTDYNTTHIDVTQIAVVDQQPVSCTLAPRLSRGTSAMVTLGPLPNVVRSEPGTGSASTVLGSLPGGTIFTVQDGPRCVDGYYWWRISTSGLNGWMAEGEASEYWIDPLVCPNGLPSRLVPGFQGRVTTDPPLANLVRSQPGQRADSIVLGEIPPGGLFTVLSGPQCGESGMTWWRVNYNGLIGWTAEGETGTYWLEPVF